jgi:hypothetical protein
MTSEYIGWIPTITGNLSFSVIGTEKNPKKLIKSYRTVEGRKFTVAAEIRSVSDAIYMGTRPGGRLIFIFVAFSSVETKHSQNIGRVFFLRYSEFWRYQYLFDFVENKVEDSDYELSFLNLISALRTTWAARHIDSVAITLERNGQVRILVDELEIDEDIPGTLANQVYYFVRDICHTHQHHERTSDTILKAYHDGSLRSNGNSNWKRETLYALHKFIIQQKRTKREEALIRCLGVLAYARAFSELHVKDGDDVPHYLSGPVEKSLASALDEAKSRRPFTFFQLFASFLIPLVAVSASAMSWLEVPVSNTWQSKLYHDFTAIVDRNPAVVILAPLLAFPVWALSRVINSRLMPWRPMRSLQRLLLTLKFEQAVIVVLLLLVPTAIGMLSILRLL